MKNSGGAVFYGMHFYPGVAEYSEPHREPYRVFLNEDTLRKMDKSFAAKPVFVMHVDGVEENLDKLRSEADGWVIESFYNQADGKHWAKFIVVSDKGLKAVADGFRLSNAYMPKSFGGSGVWNGVTYSKSVLDGEFEHLAIVPDPRYDESVILTPEQFRRYNETKNVEITRLANSQTTKGTQTMKFFNRAKVDDAKTKELANLSVVLPKSGKEYTITQLINAADDSEGRKDEKGAIMAEPEHHVDLNGLKMTVNELVEKHKAVCDELAAMKGDKEREEKERTENESDEDDDDSTQNSLDHDEDDEDADYDVIAAAEAVKAAADAAAARKKNVQNKADKTAEENAAIARAKAKAERLRNANRIDNSNEVAKVELYIDQVARGKARYGS